MTARLTVVQDPRFQKHHAPGEHPECPERLVAVAQSVSDFEKHAGSPFPTLAPRAATPDEIARVHDVAMIERIRAAAAAAPGKLDADTFVSKASYDTALLAAGSAIDLALEVASQSTTRGLAAVRPPGHHAEFDRAMGFCLFNNVAVAARALQAVAGVEKILIVDFDVHHPNGTQHSFSDDPSILLVSTHQFPHYPGTGNFDERGHGRGEGATVNIPLPAGCGDLEYIGAFRRIVVPVARAFKPEVILVSCGFDAHLSDPLASMELGEPGYLWLTRIVRALADELCDGRLFMVLEGGYAPLGLYEGTRAVLQGMTESEPALEHMPQTDLPAGSAIKTVVDQVALVHRSRYRDIGAQ